ncbi:hypothetical protein [Streptomyces sp. NPDC051219]|uniref:hypothetical protein n=1 Tax=Streptomyces sp. NPDC051219 TaxID=3155283 RepID=UPI0034169C39
MRRTWIPLSAGALLAATAWLGTTGQALAESPSPSASSTGDDATAPTEAGTAFRDATAIEQGRRATATASTGDYLYWVFPADAGGRPTVRATVTLPESAVRHGASTWQLDVYDGLRRRQSCVYGMQTKAAPAAAPSVELSCTLRTVRAWAEPWANDPLPGSYYIRLTVVEAPEEDLGLPVRAEVEATSADAGGAHAVDGTLATPLVQGVSARASSEPADGWASGWWTDRWIWTAAGGVLAALAGVGGYSLTRGSGRPTRVPPAV